MYRPSRYPLHWNNLALTALDKGAHMVAPQRQGRFDFAFVTRSVVDAGDADLVPADMVQHRLDDVRLHANVSHASRSRTAQIVQGPRLHRVAELGVEVT